MKKELSPGFTLDARQSAFATSDYVIAVLVLIGALLLRVPFRSRLAYQWDSAQFALAIEHYDLTISQPQVPGYFLYVMLGRALNFVVGDPHGSLVWLSVCSGALLAALGFLLGTTMFGRGCGLGAAAILATGPLCWFQSEVALTTIVDSAFMVATILACWVAIRSGGTWPMVLAMSALVAATAGVRQQTAPVLLPAWFWTLSKLQPRLPKVTISLLVAALLGVVWLVPTVHAAGGPQNYLQLLQLKARFDAALSPWGGGMEVLRSNVNMIAIACWAGLLSAAIIIVAEFLWWVFSENRDARRQFYASHREQLTLLAIWALPMVVFSAATCITLPGYALNFFPAFAIVAGLALWRFARRVAIRIGPLAKPIVVGGVMGINTVLFLAPTRWADRVLVGLPLSAAHIRENDRRLTEILAIIRAQFQPEQVLICHRAEYYFWSFRHFQYYLPEYRNAMVTADASLPVPWATKLWIGQGPRTEFVDRLEVRPDEAILLVVPPGEKISTYAKYFDVSRAELVGDSKGVLYALPPGSN